jgi:hypothetical protein
MSRPKGGRSSLDFRVKCVRNCGRLSPSRYLPIPLLLALKKTYISVALKPPSSFQFTPTLSNSALANKNHPSHPLSPTPIQISLMDSKWRRVKWRRLPIIQSERCKKLPYWTLEFPRWKIPKNKLRNSYECIMYDTYRKLSQHSHRYFLFHKVIDW